jgi:hypothetical protein
MEAANEQSARERWEDIRFLMDSLRVDKLEKLNQMFGNPLNGTFAYVLRDIGGIGKWDREEGLAACRRIMEFCSSDHALVLLANKSAANLCLAQGDMPLFEAMTLNRLRNSPALAEEYLEAAARLEQAGEMDKALMIVKLGLDRQDLDARAPLLQAASQLSFKLDDPGAARYYQARAEKILSAGTPDKPEDQPSNVIGFKEAQAEQAAQAGETIAVATPLELPGTDALDKEKEAAIKAAKERAEKLAAEEAKRQAAKEAEKKAAKERAEKLAAEEAERKAAKERAEKLAAEEAKGQAAKEAEKKAAKERAEKLAAEEAKRQAAKEAEKKAAKERAEKLASEEAKRQAERKAAKERAEKLAAEEAERKAAKEKAEKLAAEEAEKKAAKEKAEKLAAEEAERQAAKAAAEEAKRQAEKDRAPQPAPQPPKWKTIGTPEPLKWQLSGFASPTGPVVITPLPSFGAPFIEESKFKTVEELIEEGKARSQAQPPNRWSSELMPQWQAPPIAKEQANQIPAEMPKAAVLKAGAEQETELDEEPLTGAKRGRKAKEAKVEEPEKQPAKRGRKKKVDAAPSEVAADIAEDKTQTADLDGKAKAKPEVANAAGGDNIPNEPLPEAKKAEAKEPEAKVDTSAQALEDAQVKESIAEMEKRMKCGYMNMRHNPSFAQEQWSIAWALMKSVMQRKEITTIAQLERIHIWAEPPADFIEDYFNLATEVLSVDKQESLMDEFVKLFRKKPASVNRLYASLAESYSRMGNKEKSEALLVARLEEYPAWGLAYCKLAESAMEEKNYAKALDFVESGLKNDNTGKKVELLELLVRLRIAQGNTQEAEAARTMYEAAIRDSKAASRSNERRQIKIGRNDPCPCGSGKKYKKCCGAPQTDVAAS